MLGEDQAVADKPAAADEHSWLQVVQSYRQPDLVRSVLEIVITAVPFALFWAIAYLALDVSILLALLFATLSAAFLVRLFLVQHDCGHGAFFKKRLTNDWVGRVLGVLTLTPYDVWKRDHAIHHAHSGNLDHRGTGDIGTLTVEEYLARDWWGRLMYRLYRHPLTMFVIGPAYVFLLQQRLPLGQMHEGWRPWVSAMGTNVALGLGIWAMCAWLGTAEFFMVHGPVVLLAASIGVWLFYIQHQFEETYWEDGKAWSREEAALHGSSFYDLPAPLAWLTANIGVHHVHHLYARIPFYRLPEVLKDHPELADMRRVTLVESFKYVRLKLWDTDQRRLVTFEELGARASLA